MSISEIFDEYGEAYFRNLESNTLIELQKRKQTIVSCGGGVVMREENTDHMKRMDVSYYSPQNRKLSTSVSKTATSARS